MGCRGHRELYAGLQDVVTEQAGSELDAGCGLPALKKHKWVLKKVYAARACGRQPEERYA